MTEDLILATIRRHLAPDAEILGIATSPVEAGMSGAEILRHRVAFAPAGGDEGTVSLVTKNTTLVERRVLALLQDQEQPAIPFNHSDNLVDDEPGLVCMEDLGNQHRPASLESIPAELIRSEARGLARIHHVNRGKPDQLGWLPRVDRGYVVQELERNWEPAWRRAIADTTFRQTFGRHITVVETAVDRIADEIDRLRRDKCALSLIHGDINPSNVLIVGGEPRFIDWQAARYGPFYLDLPHHFSTPALAEEYRIARIELGDTVPRDEFLAGFRTAAHYIGLRYMWWTLDLWLEDHSEARWVEYYLSLITL